MDFYHLEKIYLTNMETITEYCYKNRTKKVVHKVAKAIDEFCRKPKPVPDENWRDVKQIIIPQEKTEKILNKSRQVL